MTIRASTRICLVIGDPIEHSLSPQMHNAAYRAADIADSFVFVAARVASNELADAVKGFRALNVVGISVTLPHKKNILQFLDQIDPQAKKIGAVNTVVNKAGKLVGYNTDADGVVTPIEKRVDLKNACVAIIGAGGAARAAAFGLAECGAAVTIVNRTNETGEALAKDIDGKFMEMTAAADLHSFDIIVNTTPIGMKPEVDLTPLRKEAFRRGQIVMDAVYNPRETRFLREAAESGAEIISGVEMFVAQGACQFQLFTGREAPATVMERIVLEHLG